MISGGWSRHTFSPRGVDALLWIESFSQARLLVSQHTLRPLRHSLKGLLTLVELSEFLQVGTHYCLGLTRSSKIIDPVAA